MGGGMPEIRSHGRPYIEPERHDELSEGVAAPAQADAGQERTADGRLTKGARTVPSQGGKAHKGRTRASHEITIPRVSQKLRKRAMFFRRSLCAELARTVGGGTCGIAESALVKLASEDMALREAALESGDTALAVKLGESSRMHMLYAREMCAKNAKARADNEGAGKPPPWLAKGGT